LEFKQRDETEKNLRRYEDIVEHVQIGLYVYVLEQGPDGEDQLIMAAANPASTLLTGVPSEALVGKTIDECFPGLREKGIPDLFIEVCRSGRTRRFSDFEYGDDRVLNRAWSFMVFPLPDQSVGVAFEDITERKLADEALRDSELRFRALFEATNDAVFTLDLDGSISTANDRAAALLGYQRDELAARSYHTLIPSGLRAESERVFSSLVTGEVLPLFESRFLRKDGTEVEVEVSAALVRDKSGGPSHLQSVVRDITERKSAASALQQAQKLESLGVMAGGIAHDFNNLLTGILGNAMLALEDLAQDDEVRAKVSEIERAALRASELTNEMLAYAGKAQVAVSPLDLNGLVREMSRFLETVLSKKTVMVYRFADDLPGVLGDSTQIRQVVMNLITNGSEALGDQGGTVSVETRIEEVDGATPLADHVGGTLVPGSYIALSVTDTGSGMDEATLARIFDPFFTTKFTGRGLGLAAAIGIVRSHGGALSVQSEPGSGTVFTVFLPSTGEPSVEPDADVGPSNAWRGSGTVLVVDDESGVREVLHGMLSLAGFTVIDVASGPEAIEVVKEKGDEIRLVLLDLSMREMNGDEVFHILQGIQPDLPVILLSGHAADDTAQRFSTIGLAGFVHKPFSWDDLMGAIQRVLEA
jgi:PAS domain S-box-containing protein